MTGWLATNSSLLQLLAINSLLALSIYFTLACGQLSLANAAFMGLGAYTSALLTRNAGWPFGAAVTAGVVAPVLAAFIIGLPTLRLRGVFLAIATIGLGEVLRVGIVNLEITGGAEGISRIPVLTSNWHLILAVLAAAYIGWRLRGSRIGYAFEAIREDESAARTMGINTLYYKLVAFMLGAALAGLAGALKAHLFRAITPADYGFVAATDILTFAIVGGSVLFVGPILGAVLLTLLPELLRLTPLPVGWPRLLLNGLLLLAVILFLPNGLISLFTGRLTRDAPLSSSDEIPAERRTEVDAGIVGS